MQPGKKQRGNTDNILALNFGNVTNGNQKILQNCNTHPLLRLILHAHISAGLPLHHLRNNLEQRVAVQHAVQPPGILPDYGKGG